MTCYPPPPSYPTHFQASSSTAHLFAPHPPRYRPLNPFLGSRAHLSLSWLSQHFLALVLVLVALGFLLHSIPPLVDNAKDALKSACQGVEGAASVAVSLPHYMADGINEMNVKAITAVTEGAATVFDLSLYAVEKVIIFLVDIYRSLLLCLLDLAVHGSITVLVKGIEEAQEFLEDALGGVRTAIQDVVETFNKGLDHTLGLIDDVPGVNFDIPQIAIPELSSLENVTLPNTLVDALTSLNSSIPTYDELKASMATLISTPIDALRSEINSTFTNTSSRIDLELLPIPALQSVQICQDLDTTWVDDVGHDLGSFVKLMTGLTVLAMVLFIVAMALWERYRYRLFLDGVASAREAWLADLLSSSSSSSSPHDSTAKGTLSSTNLLSFLNATSHPTLFRHLQRLQSLLSLQTSNSKAQLIWFLSYIAHPYAWAFLAFGLLGLIVVQLQLAVLDGPVRRMVHERAEGGAGEFSQSVVGALNAKWVESSEEWARQSNEVIGGFQETINEDVFGWVNTTTVSINTTINAFYDGITDELTNVFNGTVLEDPVLGLVYCLLGSKIDSLSTALTWLHNNLHLTLPTVSPTVLVLSPNRTSQLTSSLTSENSTYSAPSVAEKMLNAYRKNLEQQRLGFALACGIWGLVVLMGLVGVWWRSREAKRPMVDEGVEGPDRGEEMGGRGVDEKRFFGLGTQRRMRGIKLKPLHLKSPSSPFRQQHARGNAVSEEPPSPAYALFPRPGERSGGGGPDIPLNDEKDGGPHFPTWASSFTSRFRPSPTNPPSSSASSQATKLKTAISRPRPPSSASAGFAPSYFPSRAVGRARDPGQRVAQKVRETRGRMEERRVEKRRRMRSGRAWERMDEMEAEQEVREEGEGDVADQTLGDLRGSPPSSPPPNSPLPPIPFPPRLATPSSLLTPALDPFSDFSSSPPAHTPNPFSDASQPSFSFYPTQSASTNPFTEPVCPLPQPSIATTNPFADSIHPPPRLVKAFSSQPVPPPSSPLGPNRRASNPFADSRGVGRAV
ncbi:hypothetical protein JCM11641_003948 [Rhodosporidiobolus odoratus]